MWGRLMIIEGYYLVIMQMAIAHIAHMEYFRVGYRSLLPFFLSDVVSVFDIVFLLPL